MCLVLACLFVVGMVPRPARAALESGCPTHFWMGNLPSGTDRPDWSEQAQGLANDGVHWFFTHNDLGDKDLSGTPKGSMIKYQKNWRPVDGDDIGKITSAKIPQFLFQQGLWHWGDPDYYAGYVFVPLEGSDPGESVIAVYRSSDLAFVDWIDIGAFQARTGWVAVDPFDQTLYSSGNTIIADTPLLKYSIDLSKIDDGIQGGFLVTPPAEVGVLDSDGGPIEGKFRYTQGGVFTPWGDLYLSAGEAGHSAESVRGGIHLFRRLGGGAVFQLIESSMNRLWIDPPFVVGDEVFGYEYDPGSTGLGEEPEGIDWWNQDNDPFARYPGQLHAILLDNQIDDDNIWLKHYQVPYYCMQGEDSDGDGVDDWDEVYTFNTHPYLVDADGDGWEDRIDNCASASNADQRDYDGDGVGDVCDADADGDGQANVDEQACGSDPLDPQSLAPDLDGDDSPDCVDPDDDGDGQTDADELTCGSDPLDAASISPDFDGDGALDCLDPDDDNDGVDDVDDVCAGTRIPDPVVPTSGTLKRNRYALLDGDLVFDRNTAANSDRDSYTTSDTGGCNASQIATSLGLGRSHFESGVSRSVLERWIANAGSP